MLEMRFFKGATQSEIGAVLGITQMQVSRLLSALLARLRDELGSTLRLTVERRAASGYDPGMADDDSTSTVLVAGGANLLIAVAKLAAGLASGSSAMLSEAAHSIGDTMNQVFLMASLRKSRKPADEKHPFGYGMERYFWSLLAAVGIFVLGAGFSAYQGISALTSSGVEGSPDLGVRGAGVLVPLRGDVVRQGPGPAPAQRRGRRHRDAPPPSRTRPTPRCAP